jgi:hypothetical protein
MSKLPSEFDAMPAADAELFELLFASRFEHRLADDDGLSHVTRCLRGRHVLGMTVTQLAYPGSATSSISVLVEGRARIEKEGASLRVAADPPATDAERASTKLEAIALALRDAQWAADDILETLELLPGARAIPDHARATRELRAITASLPAIGIDAIDEGIAALPRSDRGGD